jgi:hypothetical protein
LDYIIELQVLRVPVAPACGAEGLLVYQGGVDEKTSEWWASLDDGQRLLAKEEARHYESLSQQDRDAIWNEESESIEVEAESDEIDLPTS